MVVIIILGASSETRFSEEIKTEQIAAKVKELQTNNHNKEIVKEMCPVAGLQSLLLIRVEVLFAVPSK